MNEQKIVVEGLLVHEGKDLVVRRSANESFLAGHYEVPGGKVDFGEDPSDALKREFKEEVNLDIQVGEPFTTYAYTTKNGTRHTVSIVFHVEIADRLDKLQLSSAHDNHRWIDATTIDDIEMTPEMRENIKKGLRLVQKHG